MSEEIGQIPTDKERAENRKAIMALTKQERFELLLGHPKTIMTESDTPRTMTQALEIIEQQNQLLTAARAEMHKSIEERREESMKATAARSGLEMWKRCSQKAEQELVTVTKQLDRLAVVVNYWRKGRHSGEYGVALRKCIKEVDEALQSLTTNTPAPASDGLTK